MLDLVLLLIVLGWTVTFLFLEKILLIYLGAREVIDTDEQKLFQRLKNEAYKSFEKVPKVYLYSGNSKRCFILQSRKNWNLVIERSFLKKLGDQEVEALIEFLFRYKKSNDSEVQVKAIGIMVIAYFLIYSLIRFLPLLFLLTLLVFLGEFLVGFFGMWKGIFLLALFCMLTQVLLKLSDRDGFRSLNFETNSIVFRVLSILLVGLSYPVLFLFEKIARRKKPIEANLSLEPVIRQLDLNRFSYYTFMEDHLKEDVSIKDLIINHIENFPLLESCVFVRDEF